MLLQGLNLREAWISRIQSISQTLTTLNLDQFAFQVRRQVPLAPFN